jgi:hypothetical protein
LSAIRHVLVGDNEDVVDGWDEGKFDTVGLDEDDGIADTVGE